MLYYDLDLLKGGDRVRVVECMKCRIFCTLHVPQMALTYTYENIFLLNLFFKICSPKNASLLGSKRALWCCSELLTLALPP